VPKTKPKKKTVKGRRTQGASNILKFRQLHEIGRCKILVNEIVKSRTTGYALILLGFFANFLV
jgi:hypothetical protein